MLVRATAAVREAIGAAADWLDAAARDAAQDAVLAQLRAAQRQLEAADADEAAAPSDKAVPHTLVRDACSVLAQAHPGTWPAAAACAPGRARRCVLTRGILADNPDYAFHRVLRGSRIEFVVPKPKPKSPEYIKMMDEVRAYLANKEYEQMTNGLDSTASGKNKLLGGFSEDMLELRKASRHLISLANVLFSMVATFAAAYVLSGHVFAEQGFRVLFGLFATLLVAVAEGWFFARDWLLDDLPRKHHDEGSAASHAMKRLEHIYKECAPEAIEEKNAIEGLDEFDRLRKKIHADVKAVRQALKDRADVMRGGGTTTESAEASYRIRVMIKSLKELLGQMQHIKKPKNPEKVAEHKEVLELCKQHIEECENLEKRKQNEAYAADRSELFAISGGGGGGGGGAGDKSLASFAGGNGADSQDPFMHSELPDIDVEEDLKAIKNRNKDILEADENVNQDQDLDAIGTGVARLKEIALDMGQEIDRQNDDLGRIDQNVEKALDHVDNINITMKNTLDKVMKGDRFMVNCILLCVILALVAFISTQFTK
ncbi:hypothetical protein HK105_209088 [Polyrhizophydium stewartii]|uniref:t-SNARE coiled-coil homology domain-containing protein n=1 Tax=Polyrhizophydium stewartii TaxID=2732419 RepID=A0ABR4MVZ1_9FUNG